MREPVGRQLQLQREGHSVTDDFKQQEINSNNNSRNENLQLLPTYGQSMKGEKLKKSEQEIEIVGEDNDGLEKVRKCFVSFDLGEFYQILHNILIINNHYKL